MWIIAQLPQFISNIRNQSSEALSVWFLGQVRRQGVDGWRMDTWLGVDAWLGVDG